MVDGWLSETCGIGYLGYRRSLAAVRSPRRAHRRLTGDLATNRPGKTGREIFAHDTIPAEAGRVKIARVQPIHAGISLSSSSSSFFF